jgi:hypothetical protein
MKNAMQLKALCKKNRGENGNNGAGRFTKLSD